MMRAATAGWLLALSATARSAAAEPAAPSDPPPAPAPPPSETAELDTVAMFGSAEEVPRVAGSAHRIGAEELERREDDDVHRVLARVPGVYVRGEDGYGLRPNIGLRGASSDRSKKVTLMEDGVLIAPAPYSAPAAYYFPMVTRMSAVEIFKGPSALRYGPHTVGGAVNLVSRPIPWGHRFGADVALGSEWYGKEHAYYGWGGDHGGLLVEAVRLHSRGFKELAGGAPTGFDKVEIVAKSRVHTRPDAQHYNEGFAKLVYASEVSDETYLGLADRDFRDNALRRYPASALDRMRWERWAAEVGHLFAMDRFTIRTTLYRQRLRRAWRKLNAFADGPSLFDVLGDPGGGQRAVFYDVLTGRADSASPGEALLVGTNDRRFVSEGIQSVASWRLPELGPIGQKLALGARLHHDEARRMHDEEGYLMRSAALVAGGAPNRVTADSTGSALALSAYVVDEIAIWRFVVTPGVRFELIGTDFEDRRTGVTQEGTQRAILPGVGALYRVVDELALLAGVHQGFSPVAPGQADNAAPELSVNYEAGARFGWQKLRAEAIGFFNDYSNLTGTCTFSSGCAAESLDEQFDGGEVSLFGIEASVGWEAEIGEGMRVPLDATYTFTRGEFRSSFTSDDPIYGDVRDGDELPYVPPHVASASAALLAPRWGVHASGTFTDAMRDRPGQGEIPEGQATDAHFVLDAGAFVKPLAQVQIYLKIDNVLDERAIVSRRPFGARPNRPRFVQLGVKVEL
jgi:Fe(3+) dicitrate transport protein